MKLHFEKKLKKYTETIKESLKDFSREGKQLATEKRAELTTDIAERAHTNSEAEGKIYDIQKSKLEKLNKFKKFLEKTRSKDGGFEHVVMNPELAKSVPTISFRDGSSTFQ